LLIRLFKSGHPIHSIVIIIIAIVLWLPSILKQQIYSLEEFSAPLFELFVHLSGTNHIVQSCISLVLIIVTALITNSLISNSNITSKTSLLGFFFFIFFIFSNTNYLESNRFLIVNLLLIITLHELFGLFKTEFTLAPLYNASLLLGIAAMFYLPLLIMVLFLWAVLLVLRINKWREYIVGLIGISLPLIFILVWQFYNDESYILINNLISLFNLEFVNIQQTYLNLIILMLLAGIIIPSFLYQINTLFEKNIALRQKLTINIWLFVFTLIAILIDFKSTVSLSLLAIPSTVLLSHLSFNIRKIKWIDIYVSIVFLIIIINQYSSLFDA